MIVDHSNMRLGKAPAKSNPLIQHISRYTAALPPAPAALDFSTKLGVLGMMMNDSLGDCTCAAVGHIIQTLTSQTDPAPVVIADSAVLALYEAMGYKPGDSSTDQGAAIIDVLNYWLANGVAGHGISGVAQLTAGNHNNIRTALWAFGVVDIGVLLPITAQTQSTWDVPPSGPSGAGEPGSWGGHSVPVVAYDSVGLTVITWGKLLKMTWAFWDAYCDEAYAVLSKDFLANNQTPEGLDWPTLQADMIQLMDAA